MESKTKNDKQICNDTCQKIKMYFENLKEQYPKCPIKDTNKNDIILQWDRHNENYEVIEAPIETIGTTRTYKDFIKLGQDPMINDNQTYGFSHTMQTKKERILAARSTIQEANKKLQDHLQTLQQQQDQQDQQQHDQDQQQTTTKEGENNV